MKKKTDDELGILLTREIKTMMFDARLSAEQKVELFCSIVGGTQINDPLLQSYADTLRTGYEHSNNARKAAIYSKRSRDKEAAKNRRVSSPIGDDRRVSSPIGGDRCQSLYNGNGNGKGYGNGNVPPKSPRGLDGESPSESEGPRSMLDDPAAALGLPGEGDAKEDVTSLAEEIESTYRYNVNRGKLRKCLISVLKKNTAAEIRDGYRRWLEMWKADDFQWAPSRITDWLYDGKFLEEPRRGARRAKPTVDPDTVSVEASLPDYD